MKPFVSLASRGLDSTITVLMSWVGPYQRLRFKTWGFGERGVSLHWHHSQIHPEPEWTTC